MSEETQTAPETTPAATTTEAPPQNTTQVEEPPASTPPSDDGEDSTDRIKKILEFDYFNDGEGAPKKPEAKPATPPKPAEPAAAATPPAAPSTPPAVPPAPPTPPATPPQVSPGEMELRNQNQLMLQSLRALQAELAALKKAPPTPAPAATAPGQQPQQYGNYAFAMPAELVQGLRSEDPNVVAQSLSNLVRGIGENVHKQVMEAVEARVPEWAAPRIQESIQSYQQEQNMRQDFYTRYPNLNSEAYRPFVQQAAQQVMSLYPGVPWSAQIRDSIGQYAIQLVNQVYGQRQTTPGVAGAFGMVPTPSIPQPPATAPVAPPGVGGGAPNGQAPSGLRPSQTKPNDLQAEFEGLKFFG